MKGFFLWPFYVARAWHRAVACLLGVCPDDCECRDLNGWAFSSWDEDFFP